MDLLIDAWSTVSSTNQLAVWSAFDVALFDWLSKVLDLPAENLLLEMRSKIASRGTDDSQRAKDPLFFHGQDAGKTRNNSDDPAVVGCNADLWVQVLWF